MRQRHSLPGGIDMRQREDTEVGSLGRGCHAERLSWVGMWRGAGLTLGHDVRSRLQAAR